MPAADAPISTETISRLADKIAADWADRGKLIEGGWRAFVVVGGLTDAPEQQLNEMRKAYMLGAQHLYASIMGVMDPGTEPTDKDLRRMSLIHEELEAFRRSLGN